MKKALLYLVLMLISSAIHAQLGIKAGINLANEVMSSSTNSGFNTENLTGYQVGLIYQLMPDESGIGAEIGALVSQKGYSFSDSLSFLDVMKIGYKEINYLEIPLNLRYRLKLGFIGFFGYAGVYGGYAMNGQRVVETENTTESMSFRTFTDRVDYGYNLGAGIEFFDKVQFGAAWAQGLKNTTDTSLNEAKNRVFTVSLTYLF